MMKGFFAIGNVSNLISLFSFQGDPIALASYDIPSFCKLIGNGDMMVDYRICHHPHLIRGCAK